MVINQAGGCLWAEILDNSIMDKTIYPFPKANPRHRFAAYMLDSALCVLTFGIGWGIWSLVIWNRGQTPGQQILKMRVYNKSTALPARWGQMLVRQALILPTIWLLGYVVIILNNGMMVQNFYGNQLGFSADWGSFFRFAHFPVFELRVPGIVIDYFEVAACIYFILFLVRLIDLFWVFKGGERNRLVDIIAKTDVLNEARATSPIRRSSENVAAVGNSTKSQESSTAQEIREATELFQSGHISEDEYSKLKRKIIEGK